MMLRSLALLSLAAAPAAGTFHLREHNTSTRYEWVGLTLLCGCLLLLAVAVVGKPEFLDARQKLAVAYLKSGQVEASKRELAVIQQMKEEGEGGEYE